MLLCATDCGWFGWVILLSMAACGIQRLGGIGILNQLWRVLTPEIPSLVMPAGSLAVWQWHGRLQKLHCGNQAVPFNGTNYSVHSFGSTRDSCATRQQLTTGVSSSPQSSGTVLNISSKLLFAVSLRSSNDDYCMLRTYLASTFARCFPSSEPRHTGFRTLLTLGLGYIVPPTVQDFQMTSFVSSHLIALSSVLADAFLGFFGQLSMFSAREA